MQVVKTYPEIWSDAKKAIKTLLLGFLLTGRLTVLLPVNVAATVLKAVKNGICAAPLVAVGITLAIGAFTCATIYADCRYKIETLTWQRDQNALKIDSMLIQSGMKEAPKGWWQNYGK